MSDMAEQFRENLEQADLDLSEGYVIMDMLGEICTKSKMLAHFNDEQIEAVIEASGEVGETLGYNADPDRIPRDERDEILRKAAALSEHFRGEEDE